MRFLFNSRNTACKNPFGAVRVGQAVRFSFPFVFRSAVYGVGLLVEKYTGEVVNIPLFRDEKPEEGFFFNGSADGAQSFSTDLILSEEGIYFYGFEVYTEAGTVAVGRGKAGGAKVGGEKWQLTVYGAYPDTPHPLSGGVIYHIFADRFKKGKTERTAIKPVMKEWNELPGVADADGVFRANDFFGGNAEGVIERLDYIADLGVNIIYLSPIFKAASNHRYDTGDYFEIDPLFGDGRVLKRLIDEAEKRGMIVMMDGVFNHTGDDSLYFNKYGNYPSVGAYQSRESDYYDWYCFTKFPDEYLCWWGVRVVPTLNKANPRVRELICKTVEKWTAFGFKGLRLDVADELPKDYIYEIRKIVKTIAPDGYLLGEVWEDASNKTSYGTMRPYLLGGQLDSVMNYPFRDAILSFVKYGGKEKLIETVTGILENYPPYAVSLLMNVIDTHDTVRALNFFLNMDVSGLSKAQKRELVLSENDIAQAVEKLKTAALLQFTLPGIPSVYYGDEVGLMGFEDPLNRAPYPYGRENYEILDFYKRLGRFRKKFKTDLSGGFRFDTERQDFVLYFIANGRAAVVINGGEPSHYAAERACEDILTDRTFKKGAEIPLKAYARLLLAFL
ncbi:MAG: glycoside hydrolase family 13 protein [Clostridiales bacterium]|jgi:glycosidase|nr:glycoside hydrolase family 13 protein [Clostridiales bacterium]